MDLIEKGTHYGNNIETFNVHHHYDTNHGKRQFTNKDMVVPFTKESSNGTQCGTYVQRDDLLNKISISFKSHRIVFLSGMGGCGKSELARAYADMKRDAYDEIFWLTWTCTDGDTPDLMNLIENADLLEKPKKSDIANLTNKSLIVIDNCNTDNPKFLHEIERGTGKAFILVTTRLSCVGFYDSVISVESDNKKEFSYAVFRNNFCRRSRWGNSRNILGEEKRYVQSICESVQFNTMIISLIGVYLREHKDLSIKDCAKKIVHGVGQLEGKIKYSKDLYGRNENMKDILRFLYSDVIGFSLSEAQKEIFTLLSLTPAFWYETDYIFILCNGNHNNINQKDEVKDLLDFGWLQGDEERMALHPLIAEAMSYQPDFIKDSSFFNRVLINYLGQGKDFYKKNRILINRILDSSKASLENKVAAMLLLNHSGYRKLFSDIHPEIESAYFVYVNVLTKRYFLYQDLGKNITGKLTCVPSKDTGTDEAVLLKIYSTNVQYTLDCRVLFFGKRIGNIPDGLCHHEVLLNRVLLPKVNSIGTEAFYGCSGLTGELNFPKGLTLIGDRAFYGCNGLNGELTFQTGLITIGDSAFFGCSKLKGKLNLPNSLTTIGKRSFYGCSGLSGNLNFPDSLKSIGDYAFYDCRGLSGKLVLPEGLTTIGEGVFAGCRNLKGKLNLPNGLTAIGRRAFDRCSELSGNLNFPNSLKSIGDYAFYGCRGLYGKLILPEGLTTIGDGVFAGCTGFTDVYIPSSLKKFGKSIFFGCNGLSNGYNLYSGQTMLRKGTEAEKNDQDKSLDLSSELKSIKSFSYFYCRNLRGKLRFSQSLESIGDYAFYYCSEIVGELELPPSLRSIGECAFYRCNRLSGKLHLPHSLSLIGAEAFFGCSGLSGELILPSSLTTIEQGVFSNCSRLSGDLSFPPNVTSIGANAFLMCKGFDGKLNLPPFLTSIENGTFCGCSGLNGELALPLGVKSIGVDAFSACSGLNGALKLPPCLISIGDYAFCRCSRLSGMLNLPSNLISIGKGSFFECSGFTGKLNLPETLKSIGDDAFSGCSGLSGEIRIPSGVVEIGSMAFNGCTGIDKIIISNPDIVISHPLFSYAYSSIILCGYKNSTVEKHAYDNGLIFEEIQ